MFTRSRKDDRLCPLQRLSRARGRVSREVSEIRGVQVQQQAHSGGSAKRNARKCIRRKGGASAAEEIQKKMKRFFLVGNIDDVLNELRALAALETFRDGRLADVL